MADLTGFDAAYPPGSPPPDQVVFGYLGGDTPHPWTLAEWKAQPARYRVGIWTRSNPVDAAQGTTEGRAALAAWHAIGAPTGTLIGLDLEMAVNGPYVAAFDAEVVAGGCKVAAYGSKSTLFQNPKPSGGYWVADITNSPHLAHGTIITQWEFESGWDDDTIAASAVGMLWDTQAQGGGTMTMNWNDTIKGIGGRPDGNRVDYMLTDVSRFRDLLWGDKTVTVPAGSPMAQWLAFLAAASGEETAVAAIAKEVAALTAPKVDATALATALAADTAFVHAIAAAVVSQIGTDLKG